MAYFLLDDIHFFIINILSFYHFNDDFVTLYVPRTRNDSVT